mgnify:CR=1 FL=1
MPRNATDLQEYFITEYKIWRDISITHSNPFDRLVEYLKKYPVCRKHRKTKKFGKRRYSFISNFSVQF